MPKRSRSSTTDGVTAVSSLLSVFPATMPAKLPDFEPSVRRAPRRVATLSAADVRLAVSNALRYLPEALHAEAAPMFLKELLERGRIYAYAWRPATPPRALPLDEYEGACTAGRASRVMVDNNLDPAVALYPYELVTYGESGQVVQNWLQYRLLCEALRRVTDDSTIVLSSGHVVGIFPTSRAAPRLMSTNGLLVGSFDNARVFARLAALGVSNYGQMTAGGLMYIGPAGIVHGTYITLLNAARMFCGSGDPATDTSDLSGRLFVTSGLGGMSGAQPKAAVIGRGVCIVAEVDASRVETRRSQGWVMRVSSSLAECVAWAKAALAAREPLSIAYHGNVVDLLEYLLNQDEVKVDLLSDQTSCHAVYEGGYTPAGLDYAASVKLLGEDQEKFRSLVDASLRRHYELVQRLVKEKGAQFWDYGNAFLKSVFDAGVPEVARVPGDDQSGFVLPSYVENIMGPLVFDYGYGPFRWVCLSGKESDLLATDAAAASALREVAGLSPSLDRDNIKWIEDAHSNRLVVGSQARILYAEGRQRVAIALRFNAAVRDGHIGPVMLGRDHHDVSGTDSPFRETSSVADGSHVTADMSHHNWAGNAVRGMSMVVMNNGGGVGIGKSINGGFGLVLDGSEHTDAVIRSALDWDVHSGVARRAWARSESARAAAERWNGDHAADGNEIVLPTRVADSLLDSLPIPPTGSS